MMLVFSWLSASQCAVLCRSATCLCAALDAITWIEMKRKSECTNLPVVNSGPMKDVHLLPWYIRSLTLRSSLILDIYFPFLFSPFRYSLFALCFCPTGLFAWISVLLFWYFHHLCDHCSKLVASLLPSCTPDLNHNGKIRSFIKTNYRRIDKLRRTTRTATTSWGLPAPCRNRNEPHLMQQWTN